MRIQNRVEKRYEIAAYNQMLKLNLPVFLLEWAIYTLNNAGIGFFWCFFLSLTVVG